MARNIIRNIKGYSKNPSDSIVKFQANVLFSEKHSDKFIIYYYKGKIIKGINEIFGEDTARVAFYYDADRMIYPNQTGMEKAAESVRNQSISWKNIFPIQ